MVRDTKRFRFDRSPTASNPPAPDSGPERRAPLPLAMPGSPPGPAPALQQLAVSCMFLRLCEPLATGQGSPLTENP